MPRGAIAILRRPSCCNTVIQRILGLAVFFTAYWAKVGTYSAPAGNHPLILMLRRVKSGIVPGVEPERKSCHPDAWRSPLMDRGQNCPKTPPISHGQGTRACSTGEAPHIARRR